MLHMSAARSPSVRWGHRKLCPVAKLDNEAGRGSNPRLLALPTELPASVLSVYRPLNGKSGF